KMIQDGILQNRRIEDIRSDLFNKVLPSVFRPELINRFDGVIVFKPLTYEQVHRIAEKILASIRSKLRAQDIQMKITREAVEKLSKLGFDSVYGARPLRRIISEKVENPIAGKILRAEINKGDTVIIRECDI
ncbi:MAG TPA: hypothetical protein PKL83_03825, partial [bacterium]|nr:hypothetical protein [bacterium]